MKVFQIRKWNIGMAQKEGIGKSITHSSVLYYHSIIIMGMLLGFDSYTKCVLILYKLFRSVFTRTCIFPMFFVVI